MPLPSSMRAAFLPLILLLALALHIGARGASRLEPPRSSQAKQQTYLLPPAKTLRAALLNYTSLAADLVWVRALIYFGEVRMEQRGVTFEHLDEYADTVVALDPDFYPIYNWLTATYMATREELTHEDILAMNRFLDIGIQRFPTSHDLLYRAGLNAIGYSNRHRDQDRVIQLGESIDYLERCMRLAGCPDNAAFIGSWMRARREQLAGRQLSEDELRKERESSLKVYPRLSDPIMRGRMRRQLLALGVSEAQIRQVEREQIGRVRLDYEARASYLPLDLWALTVSPRP